jgi:hypothetical protein
LDRSKCLQLPAHSTRFIALTLQIEFGDQASRDRVQQAWVKHEEAKTDDWAMPKVEVSTRLKPAIMHL